MNTLEQISIRSPADKNETCAKFIIDDVSFPFVFHDVTKAGQKYTLGFYVKSEAAGSLTIFDKVYNTTSEWQKIAITFDSTETNISIFFSTLGTYYLYHTQLEIGNKDTDFERAPEDIEEDIQSILKKTAELIVDLDAITSRVYSVEQDATSLESRVSTAESKLTKDGLVTTIGSYYTTLGQLNNAIDGIDIGGRNLLTKTKTLDTTGVAEKLDETYLGFTVGHYDATSLDTSSYKDVLSGWIPTKEPEAGGQYVLSFYAKGSGQIRTHFYGGSYKTILSENSSNNTNTTSDGFSIFNLTSEWKKYWVRYTLESSNTLSTTGNKTVLFRVYGGNEVYVCGVKLEKGNKPTDWSPAPEDAGTIDDIIIGGRNLILQSKDFTTGSKYWSIASPWTTSVDDEGYTVASINVIGNSSTAWYRLIPQNNIPTSECTNGVIVSFDFMCDDLAALDNKCICSLQNYASDGSRIAWYEPTFDTTHARYIPGVYSFSEELENGKWVRVTVKFTYADLTKTHTEAIPDYSRLSFNLVQNGSIHIKRCKAEYGNKATDWTPAPEDVDASISYATSIATQTAEKFNWIVKSGTSSTNFTLTDRTATLIAQTISLNGDVKVNGDMLVDGSITTDKFSTNALMSTNYAYSSGNYSTAGTYFDLSTGMIRSKNFAITTTGDVYFKGDVDATSIVAKNEYKIYTTTYDSETIITASGWNAGGKRNIIFGFHDKGPSYINIVYDPAGDDIYMVTDTVYIQGALNVLEDVLINSSVTSYGKMDVYGALTSAADTNLRFPIGAGTANDGPYVQLRKSGNTDSYALSLVYYNADGGSTFNTIVNSSGELCLKSGSTTLVVSASMYVLLQASGFALRVGAGQNTANDTVLPVTTANAVYDNKVYLGASASRFKVVYATEGILTSSDERDKDIYELDDRYFEWFNKLNVVGYRWKDGGNKINIGLGAQSTESAAIECGLSAYDIGAISHDRWDNPNPDGRSDRYSLHYEQFAVLAIPVVQKHSVTLTEHAAKLVNIESKLESLKIELDEAHIEIARLKKLVNAS